MVTFWWLFVSGPLRRMRISSLDFWEFGLVFNECKIHLPMFSMLYKHQDEIKKLLANFLQNLWQNYVERLQFNNKKRKWQIPSEISFIVGKYEFIKPKRNWRNILKVCFLTCDMSKIGSKRANIHQLANLTDSYSRKLNCSARFHENLSSTVCKQN